MTIIRQTGLRNISRTLSRYNNNLIEFCRFVTQRIRAVFVILALVLVFLAPFVGNLGFKISAILAFLTNLLLLGFEFKTNLFNKISEIKKSIDEIKESNPFAFSSSIKIIDPLVTLPVLIGTSIEGSLAPALRESIDLKKLYKVRAYCDFLKTERGKKYPPILVCTGRSQGYVELLAQALGLTEGRVEVPFIIEMGTALYYPFSKKTEFLVNEEEELLIREIGSILRQAPQLQDVIFEPKSFIVTVNPSNGKTVHELFIEITSLLATRGLSDRVEMMMGNTAVDIIPKRIDRLSILRRVVADYTGGRQSLKSIVSIVESNGDAPIISHVGEAYCSESEATHDIERTVRDKFGSDYVLKGKNIDVFVSVLERTCGIQIL